MKFILNTAIDPHFCAVFDEQGKLIERREWENRPKDGQEIFSFLEKIKVEDITFIGGVSGPGGFSSLRAGGGILNALSFARQIPIHQIRAEIWIREFLGSDSFLLNSFSDGVFFPDGEELIRISVEEAVQKFANQEMWVELLPEEKKNKFKKQLKKSFTNSEQVLLEVLEKTKPVEQFEPAYEFPPV